jgi:hypothetical protein
MTRISTSAALLLLLACAASATPVNPTLPLVATGPVAATLPIIEPIEIPPEEIVTTPPEEPLIPPRLPKPIVAVSVADPQEDPVITSPEEPIDTPGPITVAPTGPHKTRKHASLLEKLEKRKEALLAQIKEHLN